MLEVVNLQKHFGNFCAINDLSFTIKSGKILGLIGQNGAGKTTTFRLILNLLAKETGNVMWSGHPLNQTDYNEIGFLPEERGLDPKDTVENQLYFFAELRGKSKKEIDPLIDKYMEKFQVKGKRKDKIKKLSKGNQQKIQLIVTLIHQPKLIILDEPFSGLDPVNTQILIDGILEMKAKGASIIFSSHNMDNVEKLCDQLIMLQNGKMILNGSVQKIRESYGRTRLTIESKLTKQELLNITGVKSVKETSTPAYHLILENPSIAHDIWKKATLETDYLPVFSTESPTLEEIFKMKVGEVHA
ncbi:MAG: ATP-binding cassette domain-containing protein [Lactobacillales bacterium]|jgi:ABC-2 type transport system ATP-binding protein|nr:ATP-binding cassette domain-containing protein [Lactobacillales bacterium]